MNKIIGREEEIQKLNNLFKRSQADLVAIYGRRRVGKTYLVRHFFKNKKCIYFEATGLKDGSLPDQLKLFAQAISRAFYDDLPLKTPVNWLEAFDLLETSIKKKKGKIVLFFDELPWFSTPKSGFLQSLDHFWNTRWALNENLKLIVCGSAASWMLENLIHAKGGLHNRLTAIIPLRPFTLKETKVYLLAKGIRFSSRQIIDLYMAIGGIPHYLNEVEPGLSVAQVLNKICFQKDGLLFNEFRSLFSSLFDNAEIHNELIRILSTRKEGFTRDEILEKSKFSSSGGWFKQHLSELEEAGFISGYVPLGNRKKGVVFRISDEYVLFYLKWIEPVTGRIKNSLKNDAYWESKMQSQAWKSWSGYAFESICFKHIDGIKKSLGLQVISCEVGGWQLKIKNEEGCQIDMLIDRSDGIINLCEMKYYTGPYILSKKEVEELNRKASFYRHHTKTSKAIHLTIITPEGLMAGKHNNEIDNQVLIKNLFL